LSSFVKFFFLLADMLLNFTGSDEMKWLYGVQTGEWGRLAQQGDGGTAIHCPNERFAVLRLFSGARQQQQMFGLDQIESVSRSLACHADSYVSQATFVGASRRKAFFSRVRACWVDLDFHNQGRLLDSAMVSEIRQHCDQLDLPQPSLIISSGRGAYLKWVLERPVTDLPTWDAAQSMLVLLFQSFVADKNARDACRVFRVLGSHNAKVEDPVRREVKAIDGTGQEVLFETLAAALEHARSQITLPQIFAKSEQGVGSGATRRPRSATLDRWSERLLHAAECGSTDELELFARLREPIMQSGKFSVASLGWSRFCDLRDLYVNRGGIPIGQRDLSMLWMLNSLGHAGIVTPENFESEVRSLLRAFPMGKDGYDPLQDGSMQTLRQRLFRTHVLCQDVKSGKIDPSAYIDPSSLLYRPGNQFLINAFDISEDEQKSLKVLISAQEKLRRADAKAPGRTQRREQRKSLKARVQQLLQECGGVCANIAALARTLGEAVSRVWRMVKAIQSDGGLSSSPSSTPVAQDCGPQAASGRVAEGLASNSSTRVAQVASTSASSANTSKAGNLSEAAQAPKSWKALAKDFVSFFTHGKKGTVRQRSILGSYGARHEQSLKALKQATAKPKKTGFAHWRPAFTKDLSDFYRAHGAWPSPEQRQSLMEWHMNRHQAALSATKRPEKEMLPGGLGNPEGGASGESSMGTAAPLGEKPREWADLPGVLMQKKAYISTKDLFIAHYGPESAQRWESMSMVDRLRASARMHQDILDRAKQSTQALTAGIKERWQKMAQKDRATIDAAASQEEALMAKKVSNALEALIGTWRRKRATSQSDAPCCAEA